MNMRIGILLFLVLPFVSLGQRNPRIPNGSIFELTDGTKLIGQILANEKLTKKMVIITGDTISIPPHLVRRALTPDFIDLYNKRRFHYRQGILFDYSIGGGSDGYHQDFSVGKRLNSKIDYGFGIGHHYNYYGFRIEGGWESIDASSVPVFAHCRYQLTQSAYRVYLRAKAGYAINLNTWSTTNVGDGVYLNGSLGIMLPSKRFFKPYMEVGQYALSASGLARSFGSNTLSDIEYKLWFKSFHITWGVEFGIKDKLMRYN